MKKITLFLIALIATLQTQATHIIGGQITTRCLGGLTQEVTLTLYVDNQGLPMSNSVSVAYSSNNFTWNIFNTIYQTSQHPVNATTNAYEFTDTVTVPYLDYYTFSYSTCCRSATITNIASALTPLYIESIVLVDTTCNSTPLMPVNTLPYIAVNTQANYPINAIDLDGDSLGYQLVTPLTGAGSPVTGYTLPPITVSNTGTLNISPTAMGVYDICIKVTEYRNGVEIGYVLREMQIVVNTSTGIDEIQNNTTKDKTFYDVLGRKVNTNFDGLKVYSK